MERLQHFQLAGVVVRWPAGEILDAVESQPHLLGLHSPQQFRDAWEGRWIVGKALPGLVPSIRAVGQPFGSRELTILGGIELELFLPDCSECTPTFFPAAQLEALRIRHPLQQVASGVFCEQGVEVFCLQTLAAQLIQRHGGQFAEGSAESCLGGLISGEVEIQRIGRAEKSGQGPIAPIALQPWGAAKHQLDQRLQLPSATFTGS